MRNRTLQKLRADDAMGGDEVEPYAIGQDVTIVSAPDAALVGQVGTIVSQHRGVFYAVDVAGAISYQPDGNLGGERPASAETTEAAPPAEMPAPVAPPAAAPTPAALAALGGATAAGQLDAARVHGLGRDVLARTKAATPAAAMMAVEAGLLAASQLPALRAQLADALAKLGAADASADLAARTKKLTAAMGAAGLGRTAFFDVKVEQKMVDGKPVDVEVLTPKAVWRRGTLEDLDEQLAALTAGGAPVVRAKASPALDSDGEIPAEVAEYAASRGITDPKKIKALARHHGGNAPQEQSR